MGRVKIAAVCFVTFVVGILLGAQLHRYDYVKVTDLYPGRFDRWTGKSEIMTYKLSDDARAAFQPVKSPNPSWGAGDAVVSPSPQK